ncbi:TonB-dependent receptor domain-containing protein [Alteraurantiacibacter aquimixticola]|uniref:TonB-dependent receptor n=1 Tax=Alteraurantiacibacter aquimixticola TaxID=2489173 RepID=A0A4V4U9C6_9SPHN|nr:TonB-dependent receptor [Alteraurantiacibacter aquimixticola]TIX51497.1 TonB-dependent receptor [Alteraurantiacibacter aquimixticola]
MKFADRQLCLKAALMAGCGALGLTNPAYAQVADSAEGSVLDEIEEGENSIVVTGTRIRARDFEANSPIVTVDAETFEDTSSIGVENILNRLPQFVPAVTQFTTTDVQNSATNTVGASTVSLRGLGPNRNLVLLNGRRAQPVNAALVVDTNSIPSAAIQRVEIISGGASAVYGADAVGGVVNFILKDNFDGLTVDGQYGITEVGDSETYRVSGLWGTNYASGRGNVMFGAEYSERGSALAIDRKWRRDELASPNVPGTEFFFGETEIVPQPGGPGGWPSQAAIDSIFPGLEPGTIPRNAQWFINPTPDGTGTVFTGAAGFFSAGASAPGAYKYDGPFTLDGYGDAPYRKFNADGSINENQLESLISIPLSRYSFFGRGDYDLTPEITVFAQGTFSRTKNRTLLGFGSAVGAHSVDIPYGSEIYEGNEALGIPSSLNGDGTTNALYLSGGNYGLNCPEMGGCTESEVFPLPDEVQLLLNSRNNPNADIQIETALDFLPPRQTFNNTTTYQLLTGLEGELPNGWFWDASYAYGETETVAIYEGFLSRESWRAVASAPNFGRGFAAQDNTERGGNSGGSATCTTGLPLIQDFTPSEDCIAAIDVNLQNTTNLIQKAAEINLTGNAFEMWAGALQFAVGGAWREYEYIYRTDSQTSFENFLDGVVGRRPESSTQGGYNVKEVYGELLVPLVRDVPGIHELNLELGGRYSDYSTIGGVETYKVLLDWAFTPWARVRGGYNRATRAPNIGELFLEGTQVFAFLSTQYGDQCSENNEDGPYSANPDANVNGATGAAFTKDICTSLMGSTGSQEYYGRPVADQPTAGGVGVPNNIGNPNIGPETAKTWTAGLVIDSPTTDPVFGGLRASIDWYHIEIDDLIALKDADTIFRECLDPDFNTAGDPNSLECQRLERDTTTGEPAAIFRAPTNEGSIKTSGIDVQLSWNGRFDELGVDAIPGGIGLTVLANINLKEETQASATSDPIDWKGTQGCALGLQCMGYDYRVFTTLNYFAGPFNATLRWQHWPSIESGAAATTPDTDTIGVPSSYDTFALSGSYRVNENFLVRAGIENLFDRAPPLSGGDPDASDYPRAATRAGGGVYNPLGRNFYIGAQMTF